jgi:hypothetical protein
MCVAVVQSVLYGQAGSMNLVRDIFDLAKNWYTAATWTQLVHSSNMDNWYTAATWTSLIWPRIGTQQQHGHL